VPVQPLSNAAKFTETAEVRWRCPREGPGGVPRDRHRHWHDARQQARLFRRFAQADASTTRRFGGTGLGLALTRAFATMLGGDIAVESEEGRGTTFSLSLPLDARGVPLAEAPPEPEMAEVLVIDDDPHMRDLLSRFLGRDRLSVAVAANGETGLQLARELRPAAILLDVMMPRMDGWAVLSALKAEPLTAEIPVIMISMLSETGLAYSLGAADYLTKPVDWSRLKAAIDRHRSQPGPGRALVAEPDPATRAELRAILEGEGWEVAEAATPPSPARLGERRPDLLLVNMERPGDGGLRPSARAARTPEGRAVPVWR
jgi:CheY-like chemotaxis protein